METDNFELAKKHFFDGLDMFERGEYSQAESSFRKSLSLVPDRASTQVNLSSALLKQGKLTEARRFAESALQANESEIDALLNLGVIDIQEGNPSSALVCFDRILAFCPDDPMAYSNRGIALSDLNEYKAALECFERAVTLDPMCADAYIGRGNTFKRQQLYDLALECYGQALALRPGFVDAYVGRGNVFKQMKRYDLALDNYDRAISLRGECPEALIGRGAVFSALDNHLEALDSYRAAIRLQPEADYLLSTWMHAKAKVCDWELNDSELCRLIAKTREGARVALPFPMLALSDDLRVLQMSAKTFIEHFYPEKPDLGLLPGPRPHRKIRIGYYSADFHNHATPYLMAELFEQHNREDFELFGFSFGPDSDDPMRQRIVACFDHFFDVRTISDKEIAALSRKLEIDIALDLKGHTEDERLGIFSYRAAPIQVSYLGFPGTTGANYLDYVIADPTLIPEDCQQYYSEKVVYLPYSYQVNDRKRLISSRIFSREELGLPASGFVFCCFNNNYKITPTTFDSWMRILAKVEGSVLWLLEDNAFAARNLRKEAVSRGVDASRLIFANRMPPDMHLARHRVADLFLDTLPYNAHTTASDALWAGLPVLTCVGASFASRVAASLLNAVGLPDLITSSPERYEALAINLANDPERLLGLKQRLERNRLVMPLFDSTLFTKHIEASYKAMYERYMNGLSPEHIYVTA